MIRHSCSESPMNNLLRLRIPSAKAQVQPSNTSLVVINDDDLDKESEESYTWTQGRSTNFFMVAPEQRIFTDAQAEMFGVTLHSKVRGIDIPTRFRQYTP